MKKYLVIMAVFVLAMSFFFVQLVSADEESGWAECRFSTGSQSACQARVDKKFRNELMSPNWADPHAAYALALTKVSTCTAGAAAFWMSEDNTCFTSEPTPTQVPTLVPTVQPTVPSTSPTPAPTVEPTLQPTVQPTAEPTVQPTASPTPLVEEPTPEPTKASRLMACTRINFEVGDDVAKGGMYEVRETGGKLLAQWHAEDGWEDSGWIENIDISFPAVYVQVFYYTGVDAEPTEMLILNPAPSSELNPNGEFGWLARGSCHALEVAFPVQTKN